MAAKERVNTLRRQRKLGKALWEAWPHRKSYDRPKLALYYKIRARNLGWLTGQTLEMLGREASLSILKTDLWNEAKKDEPFFREAPGLRVGVDLSMVTCRRARERAGDFVHVTNGSVEQLPYRDASFDLIWDISTIDHSAAPEQTVLEYGRVLKPGGLLLLVAENPLCFSYPVTKLQSLVGLHVPFYGYLPSRMVRCCRSAGLEVLDTFKTNVHLPTFLVYPLERWGLLEGINRGRSLPWDLCKKYFVTLCRRP